MAKKSKKTCGVVEAVENFSPQDQLPSTTKNMNQKEIDEYLKKILAGEKTFSGMEKKVAESFKNSMNQKKEVFPKIQQLEQELTQAKRVLDQLSGKIDESMRLLVAAENERG